MPTRPWKMVTADGLLSGLRSKGSGSLVVQTGFPTSLADIIVKNHGRMKKASLKNKKKSSRTSDLSSAAEGGVSATRSPALGCHSSDPATENSAGRTTKSGAGFWFLSGSLIFFVALVIGTKKLVLWITLFAFSLLLLELYGFGGRGFLKPFMETRKMFDSVFDSFDISGRKSASPIEIGVGFRPGSSVSDGKREGSRIPNQSGELFVESHDLPEVCRKGKLKLSVNSKAKKLLRKFILNKSYGDREDGKITHCLETTEEGLSENDLIGKGEEKNDRDDEMQSLKASSCEETYSLRCNVDRNKLVKYSQFVFFFVVLCGLLRGKTVALLLVLAWCFFFKIIQVMRNKGKMT